MNINFPHQLHDGNDATPSNDDSTQAYRIVIIRDLMLDAQIGLYDHEKRGAQPIQINARIQVTTPKNPLSDNPSDVFCYHKMVDAIKSIIREGHIQLVETLAERIANHALAHPMANAITVRVEKPGALSEAAGVGVEIYRQVKRVD